MAWTTLAKVKTELGISDSNTSQDARLSQWISQAHWLLVKEITQETGNLIEAASVANPTQITCRGHGYVTGATISISGSDSTPSLDGQQTVTVLDQDTFTVPVHVTVAGTKGWITRVYQNQYYSGDGTKFLALRQRPVLSIQSLYYDAAGYYGTGQNAFADPAALFVEGTDYVLVIDDDRYGFSERGHVARINSYWTKPNQRVRGILISTPGDALGNIKISYTAGYPTLPLDLQLAEHQVVTILKSAAGRGLPLQSESLDYYQYALASQADAVKMLGNVYRTLANYKKLEDALMLDSASLADRMGMLPDQQTVEIVFRNRTSTVMLNVAGCVRRPITADVIEFANNAGFGLPTATFMLPVKNMGGNVLKQGDSIKEASGSGNPWNVLRSELEMQGTIYRAYVNQE